MHIGKWAFVGLVGVVGCGSSDEGGSSAKVCSDATAKATSCGFKAQGGSCDSKSSELILCAAGCVAKAECADLSAPTKKNPYTVCNAQCQGAGSDDFICDDVTGYVGKGGVCDGKFQCQDGSDEAHCADGGKT